MPNHGLRYPTTSFTTLSMWLLAIGLTVSSATQLRMGDFPIGVGEMILITWAMLEISQISKIRKHQFAGFNGRMLRFWAFSLVICIMGWMVAILFGKQSELPYHDLIAYAFTFGLLFVFFCRETLAYAQQVAVLFLSITVVLLGLVLVAALSIGSLGPIAPWYGGIAFCGWAKNPSQLTVQVVAIPFLALFLFRIETRRPMRVWLVIVAAIATVIGLWTLRDAIVVAWLASAVAFFSLQYYFNIQKGFRSLFSMGLHTALPLMLMLAAIIFGPSLYSKVIENVTDMYEVGGQGSTRLVLWTNGLRAVMLSPVVGLGPGPHSGLWRECEDVESHNTLIDWATCSGMVGAAAALWLVWRLFLAVWRTRNAYLTCALLSLLLLSMFHYTFRQPNFWFTLVFINALANLSKAADYSDDVLRKRRAELYSQLRHRTHK